VTLAMVCQNQIIELTYSNRDIITSLPYALFIFTIVLAHAFKQSRIAMVSATMLLAYWVIQSRLQSPLSTGTTIFELSLLTLLMPISLLLVLSYKDSSILSKPFGLYLFKLSVFFIWSWVTLSYVNEHGLSNLNDTFLFVWPSVSHLPFILVIFSLAMVLIFSIFVMSRNRIIDAVLYTTALLSSITSTFIHVTFISSTLFCLAGIFLLLYLINASYELAFNDNLTDIPGRLALESDLRHLGKVFSIAMLDIDHFKSFNDSYGHETGDDVLKLVASKLQRVGKKARVYRYGGEEFTILFKGREVLDTLSELEELRAAIEEYEMVIRNKDERPKNDKMGSKQRKTREKSNIVNITISIGVADNLDFDTVPEVMKAADNALYKAKKTGRNKVCSA
jgi:GGDEF domain-containing protein